MPQGDLRRARVLTALAKLAGLRLFDIKCAWLNEEEYCQFFRKR